MHSSFNCSSFQCIRPPIAGFDLRKSIFAVTSVSRESGGRFTPDKPSVCRSLPPFDAEFRRFLPWICPCQEFVHAGHLVSLRPKTLCSIVQSNPAQSRQMKDRIENGGFLHNDYDVIGGVEATSHHARRSEGIGSTVCCRFHHSSRNTTTTRLLLNILDIEPV
jgi:hypothetical protein